MRRFLEYLKRTVWHCRLKTCCFIAPVRGGLVCLASINCIVALAQMVSGAYGADLFYPTVARVQAALLEDAPSPLATTLPPALDLVAHTVLLVALYTRDVVLLRGYCVYGLTTLWLALVVYGLLEALINGLYLLVILLNSVYQIYILLLVRSLMVDIQLKSGKDGVVYNKGQGMVIIRDAESPYPGVTFPASPGPTLPAITHPGIATSITTLNAVDEKLDTPTYSDNTFNENNALKVSTLESYRAVTDTADIHAPKSSTLPAKNAVPVNAPRVGAIQSLAVPSTSKALIPNPEGVKETASTPTVNEVKVDSANIEPDADIKTDEAPAKTNDVKTEDASKKKKRGIFSKAPKKNAQLDAGTKIPDNVVSVSKDPNEKSKSKEEAVDSKKETAASEKDGKKPDGDTKKKRGLFGRAAKGTEIKKDETNNTGQSS